MFKACVGAGRANEGLRADWQRQLARVHSECGFTYIRMHGLFCDDMGVYREDKSGRPERLSTGRVRADGILRQTFELRDNDVCFVTLTKQ